MRENCPQRRSNVAVRIVDGEIVVLDRQGNHIHQLNQTATYIWERCDGKSSQAELAHQLSEAFEVSPETAAQDVAGIVLQLQELNLLEAQSRD